MTAAARQGTLETMRDAAGRIYYRGKIRLRDGALTRVPIEEPDCWSRAAARVVVADAQADEDLHGRIYAAKLELKAKREARTAGAAGESCDTWYERYCKYQVEIGRTDMATTSSRWNKWISPRIGPRPLTSITRDNVEDIRDALDAAVLAWALDGKGGERISGKTAMNVWSALTSAFKAATSSKRRDLRLLVDHVNPCLGVEPPGDKDSRKARRKPFIYPKEAAQLFACGSIPLPWRELHAIAAYTYLRPGELRVLTWSDVDLAAGLIHVTKAWDYNEGAVKAPKTRNGVRRVPIEASLAPLLKRMREGAGADALVVPVLSQFGEDHLAELFRSHLILAGVDRLELHRSTKTHVQAVFRSWRDSGITWLAMSGLGVDKIMRRAGHDMVQTTMGYVKQSEDLTGDLGLPFSPMPAGLLDPPKPDLVVHAVVHVEAKHLKNQSGRRDLKPDNGVQGRETTPSQVVEPRDKEPLSTRGDVPQRSMDQHMDHADPVEAALATALEGATKAGRWDVVSQLARELEARRSARAGVVQLAAHRVRR